MFNESILTLFVSLRPIRWFGLVHQFSFSCAGIDTFVVIGGMSVRFSGG